MESQLPAAEKISVKHLQRPDPIRSNDFRNGPWIHVEFFVRGFFEPPEAIEEGTPQRSKVDSVKMLAGSKTAGFESTRA